MTATGKLNLMQLREGVAPYVPLEECKDTPQFAQAGAGSAIYSVHATTALALSGITLKGVRQQLHGSAACSQPDINCTLHGGAGVQIPATAMCAGQSASNGGFPSLPAVDACQGDSGGGQKA